MTELLCRRIPRDASNGGGEFEDEHVDDLFAEYVQDEDGSPSPPRNTSPRKRRPLPFLSRSARTRFKIDESEIVPAQGAPAGLSRGV